MDQSKSENIKAITVVIAGRPYPLRVDAQEEAGLRKLIAQINERFNDFQIKYTDRDKQDCLVMTLLTYASELRSARKAASVHAGGEIGQRLAQLEDLVDSML